MKSDFIRAAVVVVGCVLGVVGCATGFHGSFAPNTYMGSEEGAAGQPLGEVRTESCQTLALYVLPMGDAPSTRDAINAAKLVHPGTRYLADVSIGSITYWRVGYSIACVSVDATAY